MLTAFGVTGDPAVLPGGKGGTWRVGQLVLKPVEFPSETLWRAEVLTGLPDSTEFRATGGLLVPAVREPASRIPRWGPGYCNLAQRPWLHLPCEIHLPT